MSKTIQYNVYYTGQESGKPLFIEYDKAKLIEYFRGTEGGFINRYSIQKSKSKPVAAAEWLKYNRKPIDKLLEELDEITKDYLYDGIYADRALYHILSRWRNNLPKLDGYFHKCFRQCDVTDDGHTDMVIHNLLSHSKKFWQLFKKYKPR